MLAGIPMPREKLQRLTGMRQVASCCGSPLDHQCHHTAQSPEARGAAEMAHEAREAGHKAAKHLGR